MEAVSTEDILLESGDVASHTAEEQRGPSESSALESESFRSVMHEPQSSPVKLKAQPLLQVWSASTKPVTEKWTAIQIAWVLLQCVTSTGLCFGINYGIGVGMYRDQPPPKLFEFPLPIAGHYGVLCILQTLINWPLMGSLMTFDVMNGLVPPINPATALPWWPTKGSSWEFWFKTSDLILRPQMPASWYQRISWTFTRSIPTLLLCFFLLWPIFTGVSWSIWGDTNYNSFPQPAYMTATFSGAMAILSTPFMAIVTLASLGERIESEKPLEVNDPGIGMVDVDAVDLETVNMEQL